MPSHSFTITAHGGLLRALNTLCRVSQAFSSPIGTPAPSTWPEFTAIWDTGATGSFITQKVVDSCALKPVGMTQVVGVNSNSACEVFLVGIALPNNVVIPSVRVTKGDIGDVDVLIGMDIITQGDFSVTNKGGITIFTFRMPSQVHVDYVKEHRAQITRDGFKNLGAKRKKRKPAGKQFGKNKKRK